jgi:hypothetical protein
MPGIMLLSENSSQELLRGVGGQLWLPHMAGEALQGNRWESFIRAHQHWNRKTLNPRAASTGTSKGAAGAAGNTEIQIGSPGPIYIGKIIVENDTAAGEILLRDSAAPGTSAVAQAFTTVLNTGNVIDVNEYFANGCTAVGSVAGISCVITYKQAA